MIKTSGTVYRLRVRLMGDEECNNIWRVIEISSMDALTTLHKTIFQAFDREDDDHFWSFYFGKLGRPQMVEYARVLVYNEEEDDWVPPTKLAQGVKLASLPFATEKQIHYLFDYGDEWWHKIEFLGEFPAEAGVKYPKIVKRQGESPPQYEDFEEPDDAPLPLKANLQRKINYKELEACLCAFATARPASEIVGVFYGGLPALDLVSPSDLIHAVLGATPFQSEAHAQRTLEILLLLYNQIADSILKKQPFQFRPLSYPATRSGFLQCTRDLRSEIRGFVKGIGMGTQAPDDFTPDTVKLFRILARTDNTLEETENKIQSVPEVLTEADVQTRFRQLGDTSRISSETMLKIALEMRNLENIKSGKTPFPVSEVGRNDPCPCGSGKKYMACCLKKVH